VTPLFDPTPRFDLPVSKGGDLLVDFVYKPQLVDGDGEPVLDGEGKPQFAVADYPAGATVRLVIEASPEVTADAAISGHLATALVDFTIVDTVRHKTPWRVVMTVDGIDQVLANGKVARHDS
jgi:hypothetical protein